MHRSLSRLALAVLASVLGACTGVIGDGAQTERREGVAGPDGTALPTAEECRERVAEPVERRLARLTREELNHTVRDLLGVSGAPFADLVEDEVNAGFTANLVTPVDATLLDQLFNVTEDLARVAVAARYDTWLACGPTNPTCVREFVEGFGRRALRRPLTDEDVSEMVGLFESARVDHGPQRAAEMVVQTMLLSPEFLYHVVLGEPSGDGVVRLTSHEMASALSYFVWRTMPDDTLMAAADAGELATPDQLAAQVRRMLDDPRSLATIDSFYTQWLHLEGIDEVRRDADLFPEWTDDVAASAADETLEFVRRVTTGDARFETLMTASFTYGTPAMAELYGAAPPGADGRIELDPTQRAGLLTQASFLANHAYPEENSWVHRGKFVREQLFCQPISPPPPGVDTTVTNDPNRLTNPVCGACHRNMDPIGLGFESYAPSGAFRTVDVDGTPIDAHGEIHGAEELGVPAEFDGVVELAQTLAGSEVAQGCFAQQWMRFAVPSDQLDGCEVVGLRDAFVASGGDVKELIVSVALTRTFGERRIEVAE